jgi:hypothetical protein
MLEVEIALFLQRWQEELIGGAKEEKGICFVGISVGERFGVAFMG